MASEAVDLLLRMNLAIAGAVLAVLALRRPARAMFGPEAAYPLWMAPALAGLATLLPARVAHDAGEIPNLAPDGPAAAVLLAVWATGGLITAAGLWRAQTAFLARAQAGDPPPSVVGVIAPRILLPPDDGRFSAGERAMIRAHEREHVNRMDPRAAALAALFQCLCWFNPLAHLGARLLRLDQELATDAAVLRRHPGQRSLYARTLLKAQLAAQALPFGCHWTGRGVHPLEVRIRQIQTPRRREGLAGPLLVSAGVLTIAVGAYASQPPVPPRIVVVEPYLQDPGPTMSVLLIRTARADPARPS